MDEAHAARIFEECARIADLFEAENFAMCNDTIILDPALARIRQKPDVLLTAEEVAVSERWQLKGTVHSAMAHAARHIAAAIRARAKGNLTVATETSR